MWYYSEALEDKTRVRDSHTYFFFRIFSRIKNQMKDIFDKMSETHKPCAGDFVKDLNIPTIDLDSSRHIMLVGKSRVGKTCFLNNLIMKHFAH